MADSFLQTIKEKPLLLDGGMGTLLYARGASTESAFEQLNLSRPDFVQQVHIDYLNAGAEVIETNSFSGNKLRLANFGLDSEVWKLNVQAAKIARNAREIVGRPAYVAGSIGPTGKFLSPLGDFSPKQLEAVFQEQMEALLAGGVDLFVIETMSSIEEMSVAITAARKICALPVVAQFSFSTEGQTLFGVTPEDVMRFFISLGTSRPEVIGINCGAGPQTIFDCLLRLKAAARQDAAGSAEIYYSCLPNAGLPSLSGGKYFFQSRPEYMASYVEPFIQLGVRLVGGCCGTTPEHIAAMRIALDDYLHGKRQSTAGTHGQEVVSLTSPIEVKNESKPVLSVESPKKLAGVSERLKLIKEGKRQSDFFISVELDPPKGAIANKLLRAAKSLVDAGADAINVGDSPMARVRMSSLATCHLITQNVAVETIIHFTTRDRNLMGIQADLLGCQALGIKNILALTGDPPSLGNYAHATAVYDVDSVGLIGVISKLNQGMDVAGNSIGTATDFSIACALNHTTGNRKEELVRLHRKLEAGAHFVMTQPVYEATDLLNFLEDFGGLTVPILVGIMPLHSSKHAEYLHNEVPGISIPENIRKAMAKAGDQGAQVGLALAEELIEQVRPYCQGTYLVPSFGRYDDVCTMVSKLKSVSKIFNTAANPVG